MDPWRVDHAPGLALQIPVAADVVSVGVGVVDGGEPPAVGVQKLTDFARTNPSFGTKLLHPKSGEDRVGAAGRPAWRGFHQTHHF